MLLLKVITSHKKSALKKSFLSHSEFWTSLSNWLTVDFTISSSESIKFKFKNVTLASVMGQHHGLNLNLILELALEKCQLLLYSG